MPTKISPCLWFDHQAEDAARFYTAIFKDSKISRHLALSRGRTGNPREAGRVGDDGGL